MELLEAKERSDALGASGVKWLGDKPPHEVFKEAATGYVQELIKQARAEGRRQGIEEAAEWASQQASGFAFEGRRFARDMREELLAGDHV